VKQIAASIREFGFMNPVLIDASNTIIAGHGRVMAAEHLQLQSVPCVRHEHLTEAQRRAYVIADNKLAMNADWDGEMLKVEIEELKEENYDMSLLGFSDIELDEMFEVEEINAKTQEVIHEQSVQLSPDKEYIIVMARDDEEWDEMVQYFQLQKVRRGGYKQGSPFDAVGTERVVHFERVKNANSNTK
jgi:ParB-like chromosome segregation protein Spo0J